MSNRHTRKRDYPDLLLYFLEFSGCLLILAHPALGMRCKIPYERVRENYCYLVADEEPLVSHWNIREINIQIYIIFVKTPQHTSFHNFCYQDKRTSRVCLDSEEEMRFLAQYLYEMDYPEGSQFWSAGHRWPGDNRFYWNYFGRARAMNYSNWAPDEPTPQMGRNCLILTLKLGELVMSSESCYTRAVDICEQSLNDTESRSVMH